MIADACRIISIFVVIAIENAGLALLLVLVLPLLFKLDGIWWATVVAEVFAFLVSGVFLLKNRRKYGYF